MLIDRQRERLERGGAVLVAPSPLCYVSGYPQLFSPDASHVFLFKNPAQAARVLIDFNELLTGFKVLPSSECEAAAA